MAIYKLGKRYYLAVPTKSSTGKRSKKWIGLTHDLSSSTLLASKITDGNVRMIGFNVDREDLKNFIEKAFRSCKRRSRDSGITFNITVEHLLSLAEQDKWCCSVTGVKYDLRQLHKNHGRPFAPSIDRITPGNGYTEGNVRLVCVAANYAMNQWGEAVLDVMLNSYKKRKSRDKTEKNIAIIEAAERLCV